MLGVVYLLFYVLTYLLDTLLLTFIFGVTQFDSRHRAGRETGL